MKTLILMTLAILVMRWLCLPLSAINPAVPGVSESRARPSSATEFLQFFKRLARPRNDRVRAYLSRLVIKRDYYSRPAPG